MSRRNKNILILLSIMLIPILLTSQHTMAGQQGIKRVKITQTKIYKIKNKVYTGKTQTQNPVIMNGSYKLKLNTDYTLTYKNNIKIGLAKIMIKGIGNYSGTVTKTFHITPKKIVWSNDVPTPIITAQTEEDETNSMNITIGNKIFTATLENNDTAKALVNLLPITVSMSELNGNEVYHYLSNNIRKNTFSCPDIIKEGDLMLYGDNGLVLFYETFHTSYSYVKVGHINNTTGLAKAIGSNNVQVTLSVSD